MEGLNLDFALNGSKKLCAMIDSVFSPIFKANIRAVTLIGFVMTN